MVILENFSKGGGAADRKWKSCYEAGGRHEQAGVLELLGDQCRICLRDIPTCGFRYSPPSRHCQQPTGGYSSKSTTSAPKGTVPGAQNYAEDQMLVPGQLVYSCLGQDRHLEAAWGESMAVCRQQRARYDL